MAWPGTKRSSRKLSPYGSAWTRCPSRGFLCRRSKIFRQAQGLPRRKSGKFLQNDRQGSASIDLQASHKSIQSKSLQPSKFQPFASSSSLGKYPSYSRRCSTASQQRYRRQGRRAWRKTKRRTAGKKFVSFQFPDYFLTVVSPAARTWTLQSHPDKKWMRVHCLQTWRLCLCQIRRRCKPNCQEFQRSWSHQGEMWMYQELWRSLRP